MGLSLNLFLFLIGTGVVAHQIFFRRIEIKIEQIEWVDEFKIEVAKIELKDEPCVLVIEPEDSKIISEKELQIQKKGINIGKCTNSKILVPLKIKSRVEKDKNLFFIPQFRARIQGGERTASEDLRLRADFSLYLKTNLNKCPENRQGIDLQNKNLVLCPVEISSSRVMSFNITEKRKNSLADEILAITNRHNYILVLKISPDLEIVRNLSYFLITIENITPELIIGR